MAITIPAKLCGCGCGQAVQGSRQFLNQRHKQKAQEPRLAPARYILRLPLPETLTGRHIVRCDHGFDEVKANWKPFGSTFSQVITIDRCPKCAKEGRP